MFTRTVSLVLPAQLFKLAVSLALQVIVARLLLPEGRGIYAICIATSTTLLVITHFGNEFGIRHLLITKRINSAQALNYLLLTAFISLVISLAIVTILTGVQLWPASSVTWLQLALACLYCTAQLLSTQINVFMTLQGQFRTASALAIVEEALKLVCAALLLSRLPTVEIALLASSLGSIAVAVLSVFRNKLFAGDSEVLQKKELHYIYSYGLRSFWLNLSNLSIAHLGTLVLSNSMSNAQVGIYNLAFGLVARIQVIPDALNRVLVPVTIASKNDQNKLHILQTSVTGLLCFTLVLLPVLATFGESIVTMLFGANYSQAGTLILIIYIGFLFKIIGKPIEAHFNEISGKPGVIAGIQLFSITLMVLLTYAGSVEFGLEGAAIGSSIALILSASALFFAYKKATGHKFLELLNPAVFIARFRRLGSRGK